MTAEDDVRRPTRLVSWVDQSGNPRGQTCKDDEEANRLIDHVIKSGEYIIIECRRIGKVLRFARNKDYKPPEIPKEPPEVKH